ncbi:hypothetical protein T492DRAFT_889241 [Pavlovales sp. CCMP2436]|nr:hypothetical protein T492DRAFT_889241 [Pavlovales sp. CCMP2436]
MSDLAFSPHGFVLAAAATVDAPNATILDTMTGETLYAPPKGNTLVRSGGEVEGNSVHSLSAAHSVAFSSDGTRLVASCTGAYVQL